VLYYQFKHFLILYWKLAVLEVVAAAWDGLCILQRGHLIRFFLFRRLLLNDDPHRWLGHAICL
jgi:hypothetical protein